MVKRQAERLRIGDEILYYWTTNFYTKYGRRKYKPQYVIAHVVKPMIDEFIEIEVNRKTWNPSIVRVHYKEIQLRENKKLVPLTIGEKSCIIAISLAKELEIAAIYRNIKKVNELANKIKQLRF